ncbi:MAG TPA: hypothetical protein VNZ52_16845 [Candidatus Thermoplasmatota archaeon]|nr:hypothetical protein [Candidatus Thermoplasmatota archaeon]
MGPISLSVEDQAASCTNPRAGFCVEPVNTSAAWPGNWTVDASARVDYVNITVNGSAVREHTGPTPADGTRHTLALNETAVPNPLVPLLVETLNSAPQRPYVSQWADVSGDDECLYVWLASPTGLTLYDVCFLWGVVGPEEFGPYAGPGETTTDVFFFRGMDRFLCGSTPNRCSEIVNTAIGTYMTATPDVSFGGQVRVVQVVLA